MRKARAGIVILLIVAAISLYALASLAATKAEIAACEEYRDELLAEVGALESETARLTEDAVPGPGEEISRAAQGSRSRARQGRRKKQAPAIKYRGIKSTYAASGGNGN